MATYAITGSSVSYAAADVRQDGGVAGEALAAGDIVYKKASDSKMYKAEADDVVASAAVIGICINSALAANQPISYITSGVVTVQAGLFTTPGAAAVLVLSDTAGQMMDVADLVNTQFLTIVGWTITANTFQFSPVLAKLAKAAL